MCVPSMMLCLPLLCTSMLCGYVRMCVRPGVCEQPGMCEQQCSEEASGLVFFGRGAFVCSGSVVGGVEPECVFRILIYSLAKHTATLGAQLEHLR